MTVQRNWIVDGTPLRTIGVRALKAKLIDIGFERDPARCGSCIHIQRREVKESMCAHPEHTGLKVLNHSICNHWTGHDGSKLEENHKEPKK